MTSLLQQILPTTHMQPHNVHSKVKKSSTPPTDRPLEKKIGLLKSEALTTITYPSSLKKMIVPPPPTRDPRDPRDLDPEDLASTSKFKLLCLFLIDIYFLFSNLARESTIGKQRRTGW